VGIDAHHVRRSDRGGFKAGALAAGLALDDAPYVAVFDADFVPPPGWLKQAMAAMLANPRAAFVQTRIEWGNGGRNWLTRAQRLMQDAHFAVEQDVRARRGVPFQFNGTGGIWRRAAVEEAGGWSHDTLSEDLDLVLRTYLKGWTGVFLMDTHVVGELPQKVEDFSAQQSRWSKGFVQVARKLLGPIWQSAWPAEAKLATTVALAQQLIFPLLVVGVVALAISIVGHGRLLGLFQFGLWLWLIGMLVVLFGMTWGAYRRLERGGAARYLVTAASVPALIVYLAVANAAAIVSAGFGKKTEFNRTPKTGV
jgi:cellulose synthase/poly-beta-1,6-N-acetylglucosamine synthase-like glycosyltransferase